MIFHMTIGRSTLPLFPNPFIEPTFPIHKSLSSERLSPGYIIKFPAGCALIDPSTESIALLAVASPPAAVAYS